MAAERLRLRPVVGGANPDSLQRHVVAAPGADPPRPGKLGKNRSDR